MPYSPSFASILSGLPPSSTPTSTASPAMLYKNPSSQTPYLFLPLPHLDRVLAINPTLLPTPPTTASLVSLSQSSKVLIILLRSGALSHCLFTNATISQHATKVRKNLPTTTATCFARRCHCRFLLADTTQRRNHILLCDSLRSPLLSSLQSGTTLCGRDRAGASLATTRGRGRPIPWGPS